MDGQEEELLVDGIHTLFRSARDSDDESEDARRVTPDAVPDGDVEEEKKEGGEKGERKEKKEEDEDEEQEEREKEEDEEFEEGLDEMAAGSAEDIEQQKRVGKFGSLFREMIMRIRVVNAISGPAKEPAPAPPTPSDDALVPPGVRTLVCASGAPVLTRLSTESALFGQTMLSADHARVMRLVRPEGDAPAAAATRDQLHALTTLLRATPVFAGVPDAVLDRVASAARFTRVRAGETVVRRGEASPQMYVIARGAVAAQVVDGEISCQLSGGDSFCEAPGHSMEEREWLSPATFVAIETTDLMAVGADQQKTLGAHHRRTREERDAFLLSRLRVPVFRGAHAEVISAVSAAMRAETVPRGRVLVQQGTRCDDVFFVRRGEVTLLKEVLLGGVPHVVELGRLGVGDCFTHALPATEHDAALGVAAAARDGGGAGAEPPLFATMRRRTESRAAAYAGRPLTVAPFSAAASAETDLLVVNAEFLRSAAGETVMERARLCAGYFDETEAVIEAEVADNARRAANAVVARSMAELHCTSRKLLSRAATGTAAANRSRGTLLRLQRLRKKADNPVRQRPGAEGAGERFLGRLAVSRDVIPKRDELVSLATGETFCTRDGGGGGGGAEAASWLLRQPTVDEAAAARRALASTRCVRRRAVRPAGARSAPSLGPPAARAEVEERSGGRDVLLSRSSRPRPRDGRAPPLGRGWSVRALMHDDMRACVSRSGGRRRRLPAAAPRRLVVAADRGWDMRRAPSTLIVRKAPASPRLRDSPAWRSTDAAASPRESRRRWGAAARGMTRSRTVARLAAREGGL